MSYKVAYWIHPEGEVVNISTDTHISWVIKQPEYFGLTTAAIEECYHRHDERMWTEGKAREEIILNLLDQGFIRVRLYPNRHWSVSANKWEAQTMQLLAKWAGVAREVQVVGKYMDVVIATHERVIRDYTVEDLYTKKHLIGVNSLSSNS